MASKIEKLYICLLSSYSFMNISCSNRYEVYNMGKKSPTSATTDIKKYEKSEKNLDVGQVCQNT